MCEPQNEMKQSILVDYEVEIFSRKTDDNECA